jgi:CubicO group peptidase (beta-lactamase class C family)
LIEVVTGLTSRAAVQVLVLDLLGMTESAFAPEEINRHPHAIGHGRGPQGTAVVTPLYFPRNIDPAGGLWSMTRDLLRYARFHLGDDTVPGGTVGGMPKKADERRFRSRRRSKKYLVFRSFF